MGQCDIAEKTIMDWSQRDLVLNFSSRLDWTASGRSLGFLGLKFPSVKWKSQYWHCKVSMRIGGSLHRVYYMLWFLTCSKCSINSNYHFFTIIINIVLMVCDFLYPQPVWTPRKEMNTLSHFNPSPTSLSPQQGALVCDYGWSHPTKLSSRKWRG